MRKTEKPWPQHADSMPFPRSTSTSTGFVFVSNESVRTSSLHICCTALLCTSLSAFTSVRYSGRAQYGADSIRFDSFRSGATHY